MAHHRIELDTACKECKATGLYVGMAERDGMAVVCYKCNGSGCHRLVVEYDDFKTRKKRANVTRVLKVNPGIMVGKNTECGLDLDSFGGMSYEEWQRTGGVFPPGSEMRLFTCPAWWYQSADYTKKPDWRECQIIGAFSACRYFPAKDRCWGRWDSEHHTT